MRRATYNQRRQENGPARTAAAVPSTVKPSPFFQLDLKEPCAIVMGGEEHGVYQPLLKICDEQDFENINIIDIIFDGIEEDNLKGVCVLANQHNNMGEFKASSLQMLDIIYHLLFRSPKMQKFKDRFRLLQPETFKAINLGDHFEKYKPKCETLSI